MPKRILYVAPGIIVMLAILASGAERFTSMRNDFLVFYVSAHLLGTPDLYNEQAHRTMADALAPMAQIVGFPSRPPFQTILLWPLLRWLPLYWAFACFEILSVGCLIAFVWMFCGRFPALPVYVSLSVPAVICLMNGQDTFLVLLLAGLAILLTERKRDMAAGFVLSLCAIKFHLFLFLPMVLLIQRAWKTLAGLSVGSAGLLIVSFVVQGWRWPIEMLGILRQGGLNPFVEMMPNLHGALHVLGCDSATAEIVLSLAIAVLVYFAAKGLSPPQGIALVLVAGLLTSYHAYLYDPVLLFIPMLLLPGRTLWATASLPPLYAAAAMGGVTGAAGILGLVALMIVGLVGLAVRGERDTQMASAKPEGAPTTVPDPVSLPASS